MLLIDDRNRTMYKWYDGFGFIEFNMEDPTWVDVKYFFEQFYIMGYME